MKEKYKLKCNICEERSLTNFNHKGTHIWLCEMCPNIQFEYYCQEDARRVEEFLRERNGV
jgi:ribosomal protein L37AE/L43A